MTGLIFFSREGINTLLHYIVLVVYIIAYKIYSASICSTDVMYLYSGIGGGGVKVSQSPGNVLLYENVLPSFSFTAVQAYSTYIYNFGKTIINTTTVNQLQKTILLCAFLHKYNIQTSVIPRLNKELSAQGQQKYNHQICTHILF